MKYITFKRVKDDLTTETVMKAVLVDGKIKITPEEQYETFISLLIDNEYIVGLGGKKYSMKDDPEEFMKNLKYQFSGSRFFCSEVKET